LEITVGVLLAESGNLDPDPWGDPDPWDGPGDDLDETGHAPASGRPRLSIGSRVVEIGEDVLRAAAEAVGREVALVVAGVVGGMGKQPTIGAGTGAFDISDMEPKFGVTATLGAGQVVSALLTASGEATVEVTLKLERRPPAERVLRK
jgi:hypothetical protein